MCIVFGLHASLHQMLSGPWGGQKVALWTVVIHHVYGGN